MPIVLDANVLVVLVSGDPRRSLAEAHVRRWIDSGEPLHAPALLPYEVANGLSRLVSAGSFPGERVGAAWNAVLAVPIEYHFLDVEGATVVDLARQLGRQNAYDAAYIQLAKELGADLWTFDGPLSRNASGLGFPIHLIQES